MWNEVWMWIGIKLRCEMRIQWNNMRNEITCEMNQKLRCDMRYEMTKKPQGKTREIEKWIGMHSKRDPTHKRVIGKRKNHTHTHEHTISKPRGNLGVVQTKTTELIYIWITNLCKITARCRGAVTQLYGCHEQSKCAEAKVRRRPIMHRNVETIWLDCHLIFFCVFLTGVMQRLPCLV